MAWPPYVKVVANGACYITIHLRRGTPLDKQDQVQLHRHLLITDEVVQFIIHAVLFSLKSSSSRTFNVAVAGTLAIFPVYSVLHGVCRAPRSLCCFLSMRSTIQYSSAFGFPGPPYSSVLVPFDHQSSKPSPCTAPPHYPTCSVEPPFSLLTARSAF